MAPRLQVQPIQFREQIQPAEQVISEYYQPAVKPRSQLYDLAGSLRNFSNDIGGYMDRHQKENDDAARIRGQAEALKANGADYDAAMADGVRTGMFATFQSPQFVEGYKTTQGEIIGKQLASKFAGEYATWEGRNSQDPAAFDTFLGDFIKSNLTTEDPDILKGALPFISGIATQGYSANDRDRSTALYNSSIDASVASSAYDIDNYVDQGIASGEGVNYEGLWAVLMDQRSSALSRGVLAADYDTKMMDLIAAKALETGDPALLGLLENKVPDQDYTYAASPDGMALTTKTLDTMSTTQLQREAARVKAQEAADKKALQEAQYTAIEALVADPNHVFDDEFLDTVSALDPKFRLDIKEWSAKFANPEPEDQARIMELQAGIITGVLGMEDIVAEMGGDGVVNDPSTATQLMSLLNSTRDNANQPLLTNQTYKDSMTFLQRALTPEASFGDDVSFAANAARLDYQQAMQSWFTKNPDATYSEIAEQAAATLGRVKQGIDNTTLGTPEYATPNGLVSDGEPVEDEPEVDANGRPLADTGVPDNPLAPTQQELANEAAAAPADDPMAVWRGDAPPAYDQLSEDQRSMIDERARSLGETSENYIIQLYGNLRDSLPPPTTVDGQPLNPPANSEGDATLQPISYDPSGFVEPKTNPNVSAAVLKKYGNRRLPVSIRNNNMGAVSITGSQANIGKSWAAQQPGFIGVTARPAAEGGWYAKYATPEHGVGASSKLLEQYGRNGTNTPLEIVTKWSADRTAHAAYAATLVKFLKASGFEVTKLSELDLSNPAVRIAVLKAKSAHESGAGIPVYSDAVFTAGANYRFPSAAPTTTKPTATNA